MLNLLKTTVIRLAGLLTANVEPFEDLRRPLPMSASGMTYAERADAFEADFVHRFKLVNGVYAYRIGDVPLTIGDQALWHGIATAMWAFKYSVTQKPEDEQLLLGAARAMRHHFRGPGEWLIRGVDPANSTRIADDASNDTATGVLAGCYFAWLFGSKAVQRESRDVLVYLSQELLENDFCLVRQDGTPTTYGRLVDGVLSDPVRVSLAMAIFMAAARITGDRYYSDTFSRLADKYRRLLRAPLLNFLWLTHSYDAHRAAIHLTILADTLDVPTQDAAIAGLRSILKSQRKAANPWILALAERQRLLNQAEVMTYRCRQLEYEPAFRGPDVERLNSNQADFWRLNGGVRFVMWGGEIRATQALPYWMLASQDFFPQRHPFQADGWIGNKEPTGYHSGLDYLAAHWLGVSLGLVEQDE